MPRKSKLRGGVEYETFDQFNEDIQKFIEGTDRFFIQRQKDGASAEELRSIIDISNNWLDETERKYKDRGFWVTEEVNEIFTNIIQAMSEDVEKMREGTKKALRLRKIAREHYKFEDPDERKAHLYENVNRLGHALEANLFGFKKFEKHTGTSGKDDYTFWTSVSTKPSMKRVELLTYVITAKDGVPVDDVPHRITLICMPGGLVYYNSTGEKIKELPKDLQIYIRNRCGAVIDESPYPHQLGSPICERHSLLRACNSHLSNDKYNEFLTIEAKKRGFNYDELVWILTESVSWGDSLELTGKGKCKKCGKNKKLPGSVLMYKYYM